MVMQNKKDRDLIISMFMNFSIMLVIYLVAIHDLSNLPRTILFYIFGYACIGLPFWFLRRWKYIRLTAISILSISFGGSAILGMVKGINWLIFIGATSCAWMTYELIKEISKQKSFSNSQLSNDTIL